MHQRVAVIAVLIALICNVGHALNEEHLIRLAAAARATNASLTEIYKEWQIDKFPNFLKSCFMHKLSWEQMKLKFQKKIIAALHDRKPKFVVSFTGRYVSEYSRCGLITNIICFICWTQLCYGWSRLSL